MRIAYISYEHPLGVSGGGIGTYLGQIARIMTRLGHEVEVFTSHSAKNETIRHDGYLLHRIQSGSHVEFTSSNTDIFRERQKVYPFDLIEAAEYGADALNIKKEFPDIPLVVKLHTPSYLTQQLNEYGNGILKKIRFYVGGLVRGKVPRPYWIYDRASDKEYEQFILADALCSPSRSLAHLIKEQWPTEKKIEVLPNPFVPETSFLSIPIHAPSGEIIISFYGRLEKRKGVLVLLKAIPIILKRHSNVIFQFVGKPHPSPIEGLDMEEYLKRQLKGWEKNLRFCGVQPYERMADLLRLSPISIFPSLWENFPNVCLESMAAGRTVIASSNGGMSDMITDNENGLLISSESPNQLADAVLKLVENPTLVETFGKAARQRVLTEYNEQKIGRAVNDFYRSTVETKSRKQVLANFLSNT